MRIEQVSYQPEANGDLARLRTQFRKPPPVPRKALRGRAS